METDKYIEENSKLMEQPKGVRDFLPEDKLARDYIINTLVREFKKYGYNPLETPALELLSVATSKGGTEPGTDTYEEIYKLTDQGKRKLVLRYELTFQLARVIAMNPQIPRPFKRYQIGQVWRDGPTKVGRYKEFTQCDVDVVGSSSMLADAEILAMYNEIFKEFNLQVDVQVSNRKFLEGLLKSAGISKAKEAMISIDKLEKFGRDGVLNDARERGLDEDSMIKALDLLEQEGTNNQLIKRYEELLKDPLAIEGLKELKDLFNYAVKLGAKFRFNPSLARGLTYYTGPVFEVFLKSKKITSSLCGGGRWDNMIGEFAGSKDRIPAVGTTFGLDTIYDALKAEGQLKSKKTSTDVFIIPIGEVKDEAVQILSELRGAGIKADIDLMNRSPTKNLNFADSLGIPYVLFVGKLELAKKKVKLRDMKSGKEKIITIKEVIKQLLQ